MAINDDAERKATIAEFRATCQRFSNWGRWGPDDQLGTLNFITPTHINRAAGLVQRGDVFSLAIPLDENGPQQGGGIRFNPVHLMSRDGNDAIAGTAVRDFHGGVDRQARGLDDVVIMPLQCGTHWDALSHVVFENKIYNGYEASWVSSKGALRNDIATARSRAIGRGVLLDIASFKGSAWLPSDYAITAADLTDAAEAAKVRIAPGDIVLVRTGRIAQAKSEGWNGYDNARLPQSGLALDSAGWLFSNEIAALACDNLAVEVLPSPIPDVAIPLHLVCLVHMGLTMGETFDLDALAADCAADGVYEFLFVGPPLPFTGAVGAPMNPIVIK